MIAGGNKKHVQRDDQRGAAGKTTTRMTRDESGAECVMKAE